MSKDAKSLPGFCKGRIGRAEFAKKFFFSTAALVLALYIVPPIGLIYFIGYMFYLSNIGARRAHDFNVTGKIISSIILFMLALAIYIIFIPCFSSGCLHPSWAPEWFHKWFYAFRTILFMICLIVILCFLLFLLFKRGTEGDNKYVKKVDESEGKNVISDDDDMKLKCWRR